MKKTILSSFIVLSVLTSCSEIPKESYWDRGQAESLLSVSTEAVTIDLNQRNALAQLTNWLNRQEPANAILSCSNRRMCTRAGQVLDQFDVAYEERAGAGNNVSLVYERVMSRDCENRFITNHINPYNMNHPTFGCSTAANHVQMVGDKRQFTDPLLLGPYDGQKAAQDYDSYLSRDFDNKVIEAQQESVVDNSSN